jgi:hypothetical protein
LSPSNNWRVYTSVLQSLYRKSDSEPATGQQFLCLKQDFEISK